MKYVYFLDVQGTEDKRSNTRVFKLISEFEIPEERVFVDENPESRSELKKVLEVMGPGDTLIIRSVLDIADKLTDLAYRLLPSMQEKEIELFSCEEPYLCGTEYAEDLQNIMGLMNGFYLKSKQTGYQKALDEGRVGRPAKTESVEKAIAMYETKAYTISQITQLTGVSKSTLYNYLKE